MEKIENKNNVIKKNIEEYYKNEESFDIFLKKIQNYFKEYNSNKENYLIIKGSWGTGKSAFLNEFCKDNKEKFNFIRINLWEISIGNNLIFNLINLITSKIEEDSKIRWKKIRWLTKGWNVGLGIPYLGINVNKQINDLIDKQTIPEKINKLVEFINGKIKKIFETKGKQTVIVIDDLDRCLIENQLEFINILKNILFRIKDCFWVVCCNVDAINNYQQQKLPTEQKIKENFLNKCFGNKIIDIKNLKPLNLNYKLSKYNELISIFSEINDLTPRIIKESTKKLKSIHFSKYNDFLRKDLLNKTNVNYSNSKINNDFLHYLKNNDETKNIWNKIIYFSFYYFIYLDLLNINEKIKTKSNEEIKNIFYKDNQKIFNLYISVIDNNELLSNKFPPTFFNYPNLNSKTYNYRYTYFLEFQLNQSLNYINYSKIIQQIWI